MSVTFRIEKATYHTIQPYPETEPDWTEEVPDEPFSEINLSNINATDLLLLLDRVKDARRLYGTWSVEECTDVLARLIKLRNIDYVKPTITDGNITVIGRDESSAMSRLDRMRKLLSCAIEHDSNVHFS